MQNPPSDIKWLDIQKQIGVVYFSRLGIGFSDNILSFLLDASLKIEPFTFTVEELSIGSPIEKFSLNVGLRGFGLSYSSESLTIGGSITNVTPVSDEIELQFDGSLTIQAGQWGFVALASYAQMKSGDVSLFVFLDANIMLGGPPYFTITGLLGGLGINRKLYYPNFDEVMDFPLLNLDKSYTPAEMLSFLTGKSAPKGRKAREWLSVCDGTYWIAAGIKFTSFELIHGKLMLSAQFGASGLEIALLGIASLSLPKDSKMEDAFVFVELQLSAVLKIEEGSFVLGAALSPSSFLFSRDCHLQGGFAFCFWFGKNPHAGQFVLTVGGYHPRFTPPPYYPSVDRLGFNWTVSDCVTIKGGAYLAVTPSCAMAGGSLEISYNSGGLRAWFTAYAHFLVTWKPFTFIAEIGVEIGVSYTFSVLGCQNTLGFKLGADLQIWGPPIGGIVRIDLYIVSFSVSFGSNDALNRNYTPLLWDEFAAMLPEKEDICSIQISKGLLRTIGDFNVVSGKDFSFFTVSAIPYASGKEINIRPMNLQNVKSNHIVEVKKDGGLNLINDEWSVEPVLQAAPESLWGKPLTENGKFVQNPSTPSADVIGGLNNGVSVTIPEYKENGGFVFQNYRDLLRHFTYADLALDNDIDRTCAFSSKEGELALEHISYMDSESQYKKRADTCETLKELFNLEAGSFKKMAGQAFKIFRDMPMETNSEDCLEVKS